MKKEERKDYSEKKAITDANEYKVLYENAPAALFTIRRDGQIVRFNRRADEIWAFNKNGEKLSFFSYLDSASKDSFIRLLKSLSLKNKNNSCKLKFTFPDGEEKSAEVSVVAFYKKEINELLYYCSSGELNEMNSANSDGLEVTNKELKKVNELIENERIQFLSVLNSIPENIYVADLENYKILFANEHLKKNIGRDICGEYCYKAIQHEDKPCSFCTNKHIAHTEKPYFWEHYNSQLNRHFYIMDRKIKWTDQKAVRFQMAIDITERKNAERKLAESEDRFRKLSNFSFEGVVIHENGIAVDVNHSGAKMLGMKREDVIGKDLFEFIHPNFRSAVRESMVKKKSKLQEILVVKSDGSVFDAEIKAENVLYNGRYHRVVNVRDISERKKAEAALKKSQEKYRMMTENASDIISIFNLSKGKFYYISPSVFNIRGYTPEEAQQQGIDETFTPASAKIVKAKTRERINQLLENPEEASRKTFTNELELQCKDGSTVWTETTTRYSINENKEIELINVSRNIEERKKHEEIIKNRNEELKKANAAKDKFFNIIAHDLKSPFNAILGFSDILRKKTDNYDTEQIKEIAEMINSSAKNTYKLIENLLEWARSQQDKVPFSPSEVNLYNLAFENYLLAQASAENKQIQLHINMSKDIRLTGDSEMLKTIIRNLLSNAIKYTPEKGNVYINAKEEKACVEIEVADTGVGMDEQTKNSLFKIGEVKSVSGTKGERGTGFGLLLCKEFAEKHNGKIQAESQVGRGSRFKVTLPRTTEGAN